jgi:hypothetical protein
MTSSSDNTLLLHLVASRLLQEETSSSTSNARSGADVAKDVAVIFLAGVAIVIGLVLLVYILAIIFDRYCCWLSNSMDDTMNGVDQGPIARRAGLWGLRTNERTQILEKILVPQEYKTEESTEKSTAEETSLDQQQQQQQQTSCLDDVHHETTCAICLNEYEQGDLVLSGTSCSHLFHKSCVYEWLLKHDHCPYCRKEMVTPQQMKQTAEQVLGQERVLHMRMYGVDDELGMPGSSDTREDSRNETTQVELAAMSAQRMEHEELESEV